jgi:signal transduction histidine kinase/FixJ family two-component response regulator
MTTQAGDTSRSSVPQSRISDELLQTVFGYIPTAVAGSVAGSVFLITWFWQRTSGWLSVSWLFATIAVNFLLLAVWFSVRDLRAEQLRTKFTALLWMRALAGLTWMSGALIVGLTAATENLWMLIAVWAGLAVSSVAVMSGLPAAVHWFVFPPAAAIILVLLTSFDTTRSVVALSVLAGTAALYLLTRRTHQVLRRGLVAALSDDESQKTIASQAEELRQLLIERNKLQAMKDQFVAAASHDLRQPAQAISLLAKNIHENVQGQGMAVQTSALIHASDQINDLLNSLLDTARLDMTHERAEPQWISLPVVFSRLSPALQVKAVNHGISLEFSQECYSVFSDPLFLERILQNLLTNAIEHSKGTQVTIEFDISHGPQGELTLLLVDNGVGLDPAAITVVENAASDDPPAKVDSFSVHGMGLLIASRLARVSGHRLSVDSLRDSGTEFRLSFSTWREGGADGTTIQVGQADDLVPELEEQPMPGHLPSVLIIDDNALVRVGLSSVAANAGYRATVVDGVEEALDAIVEHGVQPEAILADWHLGDGITAAEIVPELQAAIVEPVPIIVLTGELSLSYSEHELSEMFGGVPVRLLTKPVATNMLKRTLVDLLSAPRVPARHSVADAQFNPLGT